jgi:aminoglycoside 6'-N-acetyltransferase
MAPSELNLRPLGRADFPLLVSWLSQPHVAEWWGSPKGMDEVEAEYGPCVDGTDPTQLLLCHEEDRPIGMLQIYRMADNPDYADAVGYEDAAGLDLFIGEVSTCDRGVGTGLIATAVQLIWMTYPEVTGALAGPSVRNARSIRAFEKAGFTAVRQVTVPGEDEDELILYCARPTAA